MLKALTIYTLLFLTLCTLGGCQSKADIQKESIERTLNTYVRSKMAELDSSVTIDTIRIIRIDTASSKDLLEIKLDKLIIVATKLAEELKTDLQLYDLNQREYKILSTINPNTPGTNLLKEDLTKELQELTDSLAVAKNYQIQMDSLQTLIKSGTIDSTNFLFYRPIFMLCFSNNLLEQKCNERSGVLITKDFRVQAE